MASCSVCFYPDEFDDGDDETPSGHEVTCDPHTCDNCVTPQTDENVCEALGVLVCSGRGSYNQLAVASHVLLVLTQALAREGYANSS